LTHSKCIVSLYCTEKMCSGYSNRTVILFQQMEFEWVLHEEVHAVLTQLHTILLVIFFSIYMFIHNLINFTVFMTSNCNATCCTTATQNACNFSNFRASNFIIAITLTISVRLSMDSAFIPDNIAPFTPVNITQWLKKIVWYVLFHICVLQEILIMIMVHVMLWGIDTQILCIQSFTCSW